MAEHHASVTINAPVHQVYTLFTHFEDFPKFMRFVKEVTCYDEQRSHWVVHVLNDYEWDAVNEQWIPDQQVGWRSINGLKNAGKVKFRSLGPNRTIVDVYISYTPPTGSLGRLADHLGVNSHFDTVLKEDMKHFAHMVEEAPAGALDPMSSHYLFHKDSAAAQGRITSQHKAFMEKDPRMSPEALAERQARIAQEAALRREQLLARENALKQQAERERQFWLEQEAILARESMKRLQEQRERDAIAAMNALQREPHPIYDTLGGRHAALDRAAFGDQDSQRPRHPQHEQDPMTARHPTFIRNKGTVPLDGDEKVQSPWRNALGTQPLIPPE